MSLLWWDVFFLSHYALEWLTTHLKLIYRGLLWSPALQSRFLTTIPGQGAKIPPAAGQLISCTATRETESHSLSLCTREPKDSRHNKRSRLQRRPSVAKKKKKNAYLQLVTELLGFPGGSDSKESACNAGDLGSIPGLGDPSRGGHGSMATYSSILAWRIPINRGTWQATVQVIAKSQTRLSD